MRIVNEWMIPDTRIYSNQGSVSVNPVWDLVWKLEVPSKIKIFIWRALHGLIPGMAVLAHRHIEVSPICPVCQTGLEDMKHLLSTCPRASQVWRALGLDLDEIIEQAVQVDRSGSVVLEDILRRPRGPSPVLGQLGLHETVAVASWYIWWERRQMRKGETVKTPESTAFAIHAITTNSALKQSSVPVKAVWVKPIIGSYKLNTDASLFEKKQLQVWLNRLILLQVQRQQKLWLSKVVFSLFIILDA